MEGQDNSQKSDRLRTSNNVIFSNVRTSSFTMKLKNPRHEKFAQEYATCGNASKAYRAAYEGALGAGQNAFLLLKRTEIAERVEEITGDASDKSGIDRNTLIEWWQSVIDTPVGEIDQDHPLAQEVKVSNDGIQIKMPSKADAAKEIARLTGSYETEKLKITADDQVIDILRGITGAREE